MPPNRFGGYFLGKRIVSLSGSTAETFSFSGPSHIAYERFQERNFQPNNLPATGSRHKLQLTAHALDCRFDDSEPEAAPLPAGIGSSEKSVGDPGPISLGQAR